MPATAKQYPIYGVQFHPEKNGFEWTPNDVIPHSEHAVMIMQNFANFFVQEGKQWIKRYWRERVALIIVKIIALLTSIISRICWTTLAGELYNYKKIL